MVTAAASGRRSDPAIWRLAVAETLIWAGTFYLFPALLAHWEADLGWSKTALAGAFTAALVVSALAAPLAGRLIDRGHGRLVLAGAALAGGVLIGLLTLVTAIWQFYLVWLLIGLAMAGSLYEPCFAYVTRTRGAEARRAITLITLVAGFAGTVSFPTANILAELWGWRAAALAFTGLICALAVPLFWSGAAAEAEPPAADAGAPSGEGALRAAMRRPAFWLLAFAFTTIALDQGMLITHLLPLLDERGVTTGIAVLAAACIGPMQVAGRLAMVAIERHVSIRAICGLSFLFMMAAVACLMIAGGVPLLVFGFVALHGSGYGVTSITRPVVTADLLGRAGFGAISGALAMPFMAGTAVAPALAAAIWSVGGYTLVLAVALGTVTLGLAAFVLAVPAARRW